MMRTIPIFLAVLIVAACDRGDADRTVLPADEQPSTMPREITSEDSDGFALLAGDDTLAIERFARDGNELRGSLHDVRRGARMDYHAVVTDDGRVIGLHIDLIEPGAHAPTERVAISLRNDTLVVHQGGESSPEGESVLLPRGTTMYLNPSIALLETMLHRSDRIGDGQEFPVLALDTQGDPAMIAPVVSRDNGSVTLRLAEGRELRLEVEDGTRIVRGENIGELARFERLR